MNYNNLKKEKYFAIKHIDTNEYRYDCQSHDKYVTQSVAADIAHYYLSQDLDWDDEPLDSYTEQELLTAIQWEVVQISKSAYLFLEEQNKNDNLSNYVTIPKHYQRKVKKLTC